MKKIILLFLFFILITSLFANSVQNQEARSQRFASDRILVKFVENSIDQVSFENEKQINIESIDLINEQYQVKSVEKAYIEVNDKQMDNQLGISRWLIFKYENSIDIEYLISQLKELPEVEEAIPDYIAYHTSVPNDPLYSSQWGHNNTSQMLSWSWSTYLHTGPPVGTVGFDTNAETGWGYSQGYGNSSVIIAIIDSGVDAGHADLNQVTGWDFGDGDNNPDDDSASPGHGTACSGVAAGIANNNLGVAGIAGGCSIMPLKVADSAGSMPFSAIDNALYYAANNGADIVSLSLGASANPSQVTSTETALNYALSQGVTILAATANANNSSIDYPSNSQYVISVGAAAPDDGRKRSSSNSGEVNTGNYPDPNGVTVDNEVWWGSNYGSTTQNARDAVDIIAPTILPTTDISGSAGYNTSSGSAGDYNLWFNGTSCSTPYAAGVAALIKSKNPTWTPAQIKAQLTSTAIDIVNVESVAGWDRYSGYGLVDAAAALYDPQISVTAPNGGETWDLGATHNITWSSQDVTSVRLDLYNGVSYTMTIATVAASPGLLAWPIPSGLTPSTAYTIKVSDTSFGTITDTSDNPFTIQQPPSIIVMTPNGGEIWQMDTQQMINWSSINIGPNVKIELYDGGVFDSTIISSTPDTSNYPWDIPTSLTAGLQFTVKISDVTTPATNDFSDGNFSIADPPGYGQDNNSGDNSLPVVIDVGLIDIDGYTVDPNAEVDPEGNVTIAVVIQTYADAQHTIDFPEEVGISYEVDITGNFSSSSEICFTLFNLDQLQNNPNGVYWWNGSSWVEVASPDWSLATQVSFCIPISNSRNGSTEIVLDKGGDSPLPVTLSSFTAAYINDFPIISWITQSESDNIGWNVYRSYSYNFGQASKINSEMIPGNGTTSEPSFYSFTDEDEVYEDFTYWYWLESISGSGETESFGPVSLTIPGEGNNIPAIPLTTELSQNYPNPFNPSTLISFDIKENETGILTIYNIKGQLLVTEEFETGRHHYVWNAQEHASGVYLYKLKTKYYSRNMKMLLVK